MQLRPAIRTCFSVLLFVVFLLHSVAQLPVHNYFHEQKSASCSHPNSAEIKFSCTCFSDFCLPFTQVDIQEIETPDFVYRAQSSFYLSHVLIQSNLSVSLRGPPTFENKA